jgi:ankyrin repeat protein
LSGGTPLLVAALYVEVDIVKALLAAGADHSIALRDGTTPLLAAAGVAVQKEARPSDLVRWNIVDSDTPVTPRAEGDVLDTTKLLLEAGANVHHANDAGFTALHGAAASAMTSVIQALADRGAMLDAKNKAGQTPLALTLPRGGRGFDPRSSGAAAAKAAEDLLRKLGASQ